MKSCGGPALTSGRGGRTSTGSDDPLEDVGLVTACCLLLAADADPAGHPCCKLVGLELTFLGGGPETLDGELTLTPVFAVTCELGSFSAGALAFGAGGVDARSLSAGCGASP